jgi:hypothetical protein
LGDLEVTEAAEDQLAGAGACAVLDEGWDGGEFEVAGRAGLRGVEDGVVLCVAQRCVAVEGVVRAMPMVLKCRRALLEHGATTLWTEDIVTETEVLVKEESSLKDPLFAVLALYLIWFV